LASEGIFHAEHPNIRGHACLDGLHKCSRVPRKPFKAKFPAESDAVAHAARLLQFFL
jgi:hypothetical protein